jgi:cytochrome c oxidase assembly factor CtaG
MPGMNSGLNPASPILVSAFRSALLQQWLIIAIIFGLLLIAWGATRTAIFGSMAGAPVAERWREPRARLLLRVGFGVIWLFDGILQAQPQMAGGLADQVIKPAAAPSPGWVQHLVNSGQVWSGRAVARVRLIRLRAAFKYAAPRPDELGQVCVAAVAWGDYRVGHAPTRRSVGAAVRRAGRDDQRSGDDARGSAMAAAAARAGAHPSARLQARRCHRRPGGVRDDADGVAAGTQGNRVVKGAGDHRSCSGRLIQLDRGFMHYILDNWSFDPFVIVVAVVVVWHEIGLYRLAKRSRPERTRERRIRSLWFYAGLGVLLLAVDSPIDYWADSYFIVHMVQHLLLMFAAPSLVVAGAPGQPLLDGLPGRSGQAVTRSVLAGDWSRPLRTAFTFLTGPVVAVVLFNLAMVVWHIPAAFDLAADNSAVHIWLEHGSFFATGVLFWLQFIPSPPFRSRMPLLGRAAALLATNVVMIFIAMALSIFATHSIYAPYDHVPGVTLPAFADQQIGAAILWVCGDFWALPTMIITIRKLLNDETGVGTALDRFVRSGSRAATSRSWTARAPR